ncbi:6211_t:CDS:2, partial [Racocetra persica]
NDFENSGGPSHESADNILNNKNIHNKLSREASPHSKPERESSAGDTVQARCARLSEKSVQALMCT